jgi:hypothetical protein
MDLANVLSQLANAARPAGEGAASGLTELAQRLGIDTSKLGEALAHMGDEARSGATDVSALAESAAGKLGLEAGGLKDMLGQVMASLQGAGAAAGATAEAAAGEARAAVATAGNDLSALVGKLVAGVQSGNLGGIGEQLSQAVSALDKDGDGSVLDDLADMAGNLLKRS